MIKISIKDAKRLGFSIQGYVFTKEKKTPQPIIKKAKKRLRRKQIKKRTIPLKQEGNIFKLDLKDDNV